jgi:hypothetical protein
VLGSIASVRLASGFDLEERQELSLVASLNG